VREDKSNVSSPNVLEQSVYHWYYYNSQNYSSIFINWI